MESGKLKLAFVSSNGAAELFSTIYSPAGGLEVRHCVRGKTAGPFRNSGTFQWTSAVMAVSVLALRTYANVKGHGVSLLLGGKEHSLAASLDYSLNKGPTWIQEMFGFTRSGDFGAKRLFSVSNSNRKRPGPVVLGINLNHLSGENISFEVDGRVLTDLEEICKIANSIEQRHVEFVSANLNSALKVRNRARVIEVSEEGASRFSDVDSPKVRAA